MAVLQSSLLKFTATYGRCVNNRFSTSLHLNKRSVEQILGLLPKPKKPQTPFLRFVANVRPQLVQQQPGIKPTEVLKVAAEKWKNIDLNAKNELKKEYDIDLLKYQEDVKRYDLNLSPSDRDRIILEKENIKHRKERSQLKKRKEALGCPKKPLSSFFQFMKSKGSERGENVPYKDWLVEMTKEWNQLTEEQKVPYTNMHKKDVEIYKQKLAKWEREITEQGMGSLLKR